MAERFHRAAQDGYLDVLKEATKRDCNAKDEDGMTPTLWASFEGNLDALRLLVGRGGDPEKADNYGNTALHLSSARGHVSCVTFLVNFGVSLWALDIDAHSPQELAAMNDCSEILRYLDGAASRAELDDRRRVQRLKDKAAKDAGRLAKHFKRVQKKADKMASQEEKELNDEIERMKVESGTAKSTAANGKGDGRKDSVLVHSAAPKFSEMVSGNTGSTSGGVGISTVVRSKKIASGTVRKLVSLKKNSQSRGGGGGGGVPPEDLHFKVSDVQDGKRSVRQLSGLRSTRDTEILFVPKSEGDAGGSAGLDAGGDPGGGDGGGGRREALGIFDRQGFGSIAFRNSMTASLHSMMNNNQTKEPAESIGSAGSLAQRSYNTYEIEEEDTSEGFAAINLFLAGLGLKEWIPTLADEKVDLNALMLLEETDLKEMGLPTGPRKKLLKAVADRKHALEEDNPIEDSKL